MFKDRKLLVTGGAGSIGSSICNYFKDWNDDMFINIATNGSLRTTKWWAELPKYLPKKHSIQNGDKVYTSGKEGIFSPGIPIGEVKIEDSVIEVESFSDLNQITFVNIKLDEMKTDK